MSPTMDHAREMSPTSSENEKVEKGEIYHSEIALQDHGIDDSIETTDGSKAVWLIACTVSMGGFLFGK
jgi:SP family myo-inositol transporter-like MFS transporter 13